MAPAAPARILKVRVPRHNAQRIGVKLTGEVQHVAQSERIRADTYQPNHELTQAIESASEWNSLLMTARAERGPQWDIGTQQFLVDQYSELHYNPSPLMEVAKKQIEEEAADEQQPNTQHQSHQNHSRHQTPHRDREFQLSNANAHHQLGHPEGTPQHRYHPQVNYPYPGSGAGMNLRANVPGPGPYSGVPVGSPFTPVPPAQFYGNSGNHDGSPMRMNPVANINNVGMNVDHSHGVVNHPMTGLGMGSLQATTNSMALSQGLGRRITRGMAEEGFPLH